MGLTPEQSLMVHVLLGEWDFLYIYKMRSSRLNEAGGISYSGRRTRTRSEGTRGDIHKILNHSLNVIKN